jgi:hypothetical protein
MHKMFLLTLLTAIAFLGPVNGFAKSAVYPDQRGSVQGL